MSLAWAHEIGDHAAYEFGWSFEPWAVLVAALLYRSGSAQLARRGKADRRRSRFLFWAGLMSLALVSPLHAYGTHLFSAHMVSMKY